MIDWFQHAKEQQPNPHTGREQHREPSRIGIFWLRIGTPQRHLGHGHKDQRDAENDKEIHDKHKHPVELACREITYRHKNRAGLIGKD
jgi:hypothetical protein